MSKYRVNAERDLIFGRRRALIATNSGSWGSDLRV